jgi:ribosomal protein S18 acetylase RimI-like enzyme
MRYKLRPAASTDYDFLYQLKVACLKEYVEATWGWDEEDQQLRFADRFDPAAIKIIVANGQDIGQLVLEDTGEELYLAGLYIDPAWQNKGLGRGIIQDVIAEANKAGRIVSLQVLRVNPAKRLYERLGFEVVGKTATHYQMRYSY